MVASRYAQIAPRQLVRRRPALAAVFERFGINYDDVGSGGGSTPLEQQIRDKRLSGEQVYHALEQADCDLDDHDLDDRTLDDRTLDDRTLDDCEGHESDPGKTHQRDWRWAPLAELIDHIVGIHHFYLRRELPRLRSTLSALIRAHGRQHPELIELRRVLSELANQLRQHILSEERELFPRIIQLERSSSMDASDARTLLAEIRQAEADHFDSAEALCRIHWHSAAFQPPADACVEHGALLDGLARLDEDFRRHMYEENSILFPRAAVMAADVNTEAAR